VQVITLYQPCQQQNLGLPTFRFVINSLDVDDVIPFAQFPKLQRLDLSNNNFTKEQKKQIEAAFANEDKRSALVL
jgi:hypothetical protein